MTAIATGSTTTEIAPDPAGTLVLSVHPLIFKLAIGYAAKYGRSDLADDLAGELTARLLKEARRGKYDPDRARPTTWAYAVARTELPRAFGRLAFAVAMPHNAIGPVNLSRLTGETREKLLAAMVPALPIGGGKPRDERDGRSRRDDPPCYEPPAPPADTDAGPVGERRRATLASLLDRLPPRERSIVAAYHGLDGAAPPPKGGKRWTFDAIATSSGVTKECVRQIYHRALRRMQRAAEAIGRQAG